MRSSEIIIAFCAGFVTAAILLVVIATLSACRSPLGRNFTEREVMLHETDAQIDRLQKQRASLLKAIEDDRKAK